MEGSTALWEAMAAGLPIITTDVGSAAEYISETKGTGILIPNFNPNAISNAILYLINNPTLASEYAANARQIAFKHLSVSSAASLHAQVYKKFL